MFVCLLKYSCSVKGGTGLQGRNSFTALETIYFVLSSSASLLSKWLAGFLLLVKVPIMHDSVGVKELNNLEVFRLS